MGFFDIFWMSYPNRVRSFEFTDTGLEKLSVGKRTRVPFNFAALPS